MKFQPIFKFWAIALFSLLFVTACNDSDDPTPDTDAPTIAVSQPQSGAIVQSGTELNLNAMVTDDIKVSELMVTIHDVFDGHDHADKTSATRWSWSQIYTANSSEFTLTEVVDVPVDAATGPYHIVFEALDESGNAATLVEVPFEIVNSSQPVINDLLVDDTTRTTPYTEAFATDSLASYPISFMATDSDGLQLIKLTFTHHGDHSDKTSEEDPYWEKVIPANGKLSLPVNETLTLMQADADLESGTYELRIIVEDKLGNVRVASVWFELTV